MLTCTHYNKKENTIATRIEQNVTAGLNQTNSIGLFFYELVAFQSLVIQFALQRSSNQGAKINLVLELVKIRDYMILHSI